MTDKERLVPLVWRSMLYVPATNEKFIKSAHEKGADAIKIDLEDSVPMAAKARARTLVRSAAKTVAKGGADVLVRINRQLIMAVKDLEASVWPEIQGLVLPKVESCEHIGFLEEIISELENEREMPKGYIKLIALIETPRGYFNLRRIANSSPRLSAIALGQEDFSAGIGMMEPEDISFLSYYQAVQLAAREAGIVPIGYPGSISEFTDLELFKSNVLAGRKLGFDGGACIHPKQVPILNEIFTPTQSEVEKSERVITAYNAALASGKGAVAFEGKMIDLPVVTRAERVLAIRDRIKAKQKKHF